MEVIPAQRRPFFPLEQKQSQERATPIVLAGLGGGWTLREGGMAQAEQNMAPLIENRRQSRVSFTSHAGEGSNLRTHSNGESNDFATFLYKNVFAIPRTLRTS